MTSYSYNNPVPVLDYHHHDHHHRLDLFGGLKPWNKTEWAAQDDRLRGGSSISHLTITPIPSLGGSPGSTATFHGTLDSKTLGGAGFASQRTIEDDKRWDLGDYDGIEVVVLIPAPKAESKLISLDDGEEPVPEPAPIEEKIYTIVIKDCIIRGEPDSGKEISWEWNFKPKLKSSEEEKTGHKQKGPTHQHFRAAWGDFKPYYRGKPVDEEKKLDNGKIKRFSIMIRSFFQDQKDGEFSVSLVSISAIGKKRHHHEKSVIREDEARDVCPVPTMRSGKLTERYFDTYDPILDGQAVIDEKRMSGNRANNHQEDNKGWFGWLCGLRNLF